MDNVTNNENREIKEFKKEEIAGDIRAALANQAQAMQPVQPVQPVPAAQSEPQTQAAQPEQPAAGPAESTGEPKPDGSAEQLKAEGPAGLPESKDPSDQAGSDKQPAETKKPKFRKAPKAPKPSAAVRRIKRLSWKGGLLLVLVELVLVLFLAVILTQHISINSDEPSLGPAFTDEISCSDGQLTVNTVSVSVPNDGGVSYSISYDWGKDDKDYPTTPKVAIASYPSDSGNPKYDITLYRDSFTPAKKVPAGKKPSNWFSDWKKVNDEYSKQAPKKYGDINGFEISTVGNDPEGSFESTSFYFAVRTKEGVSVYVIEGLLYDKEAEKEFNKVLEDAITSIRTKKQAA